MLLQASIVYMPIQGQIKIKTKTAMWHNVAILLQFNFKGRIHLYINSSFYSLPLASDISKQFNAIT